MVTYILPARRANAVYIRRLRVTKRAELRSSRPPHGYADPVTGRTDAADSPERSPENAGSDAPGIDAAGAPAEASKPPKRKRGVLRKVVISVAIVVVLLVALYSVMVNFVARSYLIPSRGWHRP